jgi:hypothetical protein
MNVRPDLQIDVEQDETGTEEGDGDPAQPQHHVVASQVEFESKT